MFKNKHFIIGSLLLTVLLIFLLIMMSACGNKEDNKSEGSVIETSVKTENVNGIEHNDSQQVTLPSEPENNPNISNPSIIVSSSTVKAGDIGVEIIISVAKNPCILGIDFDVYYDDSVMTLKNGISVLVAEGCNFTPPAYYRNPTTFLWDFQDAAWTEDGEFLKLYFDISESAQVGNYEVKIIYGYGNIFDNNSSPLEIDIINAKIKVEN